jgi:hypothetical protein
MSDGTCIMGWVSKRLYFLKGIFDLIVYDICWGARSGAMHCLYWGLSPCGKGTSFMEHWWERAGRYLISPFYHGHDFYPHISDKGAQNGTPHGTSSRHHAFSRARASKFKQVQTSKCTYFQ